MGLGRRVANVLWGQLLLLLGLHGLACTILMLM
jgi:hypothetical protein